MQILAKLPADYYLRKLAVGGWGVGGEGREGETFLTDSGRWAKKPQHRRKNGGLSHFQTIVAHFSVGQANFPNIIRGQLYYSCVLN